MGSIRFRFSEHKKSFRHFCIVRGGRRGGERDSRVFLSKGSLELKNSPESPQSLSFIAFLFAINFDISIDICFLKFFFFFSIWNSYFTVNYSRIIVFS